MAGFIYKNQSTNSILSNAKLILVNEGAINAVIGSSREAVTGDTTLTRPIANEYGMKNEALKFEYFLIKDNGSIFTESEQTTIEKWLTSPKYSSSLDIIDCDENIVCTYFGKFEKTEWLISSGGFIGLKFYFANNDAYPKKHYEHTYQIRGKETIRLICESDELEEYIYPTISITEKVNPKSQATIVFDSDNSYCVVVNTLEGLNINIDSQYCIVNDGTTSGVISMKDLGWSDMGNIYWPRLIPGENIIGIDGNVDVVISYDAPYKKVGGWLS